MIVRTSLARFCSSFVPVLALRVGDSVGDVHDASPAAVTSFINCWGGILWRRAGWLDFGLGAVGGGTSMSSATFGPEEIIPVPTRLGGDGSGVTAASQLLDSSSAVTCAGASVGSAACGWFADVVEAGWRCMKVQAVPLPHPSGPPKCRQSRVGCLCGQFSPILQPPSVLKSLQKPAAMLMCFLISTWECTKKDTTQNCSERFHSVTREANELASAWQLCCHTCAFGQTWQPGSCTKCIAISLSAGSADEKVTKPNPLDFRMVGSRFTTASTTVPCCPNHPYVCA